MQWKRGAVMKQPQKNARVNSNPHYVTALSCFESGDVDRVVSSCKQSLRRQPGHVPSLLLLAMSYMDKGLLHESEDVLKKFCKHASHSSQACLLLGDALFYEGHFQESEYWYKKGLKISSGKFARANYQLGKLYHYQGKHLEAIEFFSKALKGNPKHVSSYFYRGLSAYQSGEFPLAIASFKKVVQLNPRYATAHFWLGVCTYHAGKIKESLAHFQNALKHHKSYAAVHFYMGLCHYHLGDLKLAERYFLTTSRLSPGFASVNYYLGIIDYNQGKSKEAVKKFKKTLAMDPHDVAAREMLKMIEGR